MLSSGYDCILRDIDGCSLQTSAQCRCSQHSPITGPTICPDVDHPKTVVCVHQGQRTTEKVLLSLQYRVPDPGGACMETCFPSRAPMQFGKFHLSMNLAAIPRHSSSVGGGMHVPTILKLMMSQVSLMALETVLTPKR